MIPYFGTASNGKMEKHIISVVGNSVFFLYHITNKTAKLHFAVLFVMWYNFQKRGMQLYKPLHKSVK